MQTSKDISKIDIIFHRYLFRSPVLKRTLTSSMVEDRTGVVEIMEFEAETIEKLLEFIYSGEIEEMGDQLDRKKDLLYR